ncbi:MAG TPA: TIGR02206 family membrane protein [Anaerolineales bacterium]|nr:TIGR02206 family membrane protein [Anaerolineales bacterium]
MGDFWAWDYTGAPFQLFGPAHIGALLALLLIGYGLLQFKNASEATRRNVRIALGVFLWANESAWHLWNAYWGHWSIQTMLPLNACSILIWLGGFMLIFRNYTIYEFAYFMGMGGAFQYLMTPDLGIYGFPHFHYWQAFLSHGLLFIVPIYMTVVEGFRPTWKSFWRVVIGSNIYMAIVFFINRWIGSDYLFINGKPATASILDLLPPWPIYIMYMEALGIITFLILYSPFILKDRRVRKVSAA